MISPIFFLFHFFKILSFLTHIGIQQMLTWLPMWKAKSLYPVRVQIIASHFTNCEVNSSYCNCKVVNHMKIAKQFFSQGKFNLSKLCSFILYPYFIHSSYTIIKRNIVYAQNYSTKCKKCFAIIKYFQKIFWFVAG